MDFSKTEMFQVGVILFVLTFGHFPFHKTNYEDENFRIFS